MLTTVVETPEYLRPLYLLTMYGKSEKANLSKAKRNELSGFVVALKLHMEQQR